MQRCVHLWLVPNEPGFGAGGWQGARQRTAVSSTFRFKIKAESLMVADRRWIPATSSETPFTCNIYLDSLSLGYQLVDIHLHPTAGLRPWVFRWQWLWWALGIRASPCVNKSNWNHGSRRTNRWLLQSAAEPTVCFSFPVVLHLGRWLVVV